jgi:hypothetical protein
VVVVGVAGLATPVGSLGVIGRVEPVPWLSIGGGVGRGVVQTEYGGLVLFRIPIRRQPTPLLAATVDTGYSVGEGHTFSRNARCLVEDCRDTWTDLNYQIEHPHYVHLEGGIEMRFATGVSLRGFVGGAWVVNPGSATCTKYNHDTSLVEDVPCNPSLSVSNGTLLVVGVALGYALPI